MAVTFILGSAGSGKTRHCFQAIVEQMRQDPLGPPIYWLLPRQATFSAERELTCLSDLGAFCRTRVVSFDQFAQDVFEDCGGSSIPQITPLGRRMILGHLLRRHGPRLSFYSGVARQPGLAAELDRTFGELERSGKTAQDLHGLSAELSQANAADLELAPLLDKLRDTALLYDAYNEYLGQDRLDPHRRLMQVQASLSRCSFLPRASIYVDGFLDFSQSEREILVGAAKAGAKLEIGLLLDPRSPVIRDPHRLPDEMSLFGRTEETYRKLYFAFTQKDVPINPPVLLDQKGGSAAALFELERSLFSEPLRESEYSDGIELTEAADRSAEVDAVARGIRELAMQGVRFRDVAVLTRDLEPYQELIEASFQEHGIPFFMDRRRTAMHHPLVQWLRAVFAIARQDWPHEPVMSLLRSGLAGVSLYDCDGLENYVQRHCIRGAAGWESSKPWSYHGRSLVAEDQETATIAPSPGIPGESRVGVEPGRAAPAGGNALPCTEPESLRRSLVEKLHPLLELLRREDPQPVRVMAMAIFRTLERFGVRQILADWARTAADSQQVESAAEHQQVWANVAGLFDQIVELFGDELMTAEEFGGVLESGLDHFDLALTPQTVDQVLVGQVDRTRTPPLKAVFVLGLNEGEFPHVRREGSILSEHDRRTLRRRRIDLDPDRRQQWMDERLLAYIAFTRASERLLVSRPLADDDGRPTRPSTFWIRLERLFPAAKRSEESSSPEPRPDQIATPRQLATSLVHWVRSSSDPLGKSALGMATPHPTLPRNTGGGSQTDADSEYAALYDWLSRRPQCGDAIDQVTRRAWRGLSYVNCAELSPEVASKLFRSPLTATAAQLEAFAACPFQHFAKYGLGLRDQTRHPLTPGDLGRLYHDVLDRAWKEQIRLGDSQQSQADLESTLDRFLHEAAEQLSSELMLDNARGRFVLEQARKTLGQAAIAQREVLSRGLFWPISSGLTFGPHGRLGPLVLRTAAEHELLLEGKIDRIDAVEARGQVSAIDYRSGPARLSLGMVLHGLSLRLLSQLLVLQANGTRLGGSQFDPTSASSVEPVAAFYLPLVREIEDVRHPSEAPDANDPAWRLKLKPRGLFDGRCLNALDSELIEGPSSVVQAFVRKDGSLGHRSTSDAMDSHEFRALLRLIAARLAELADGILAGRIDVAPYRLRETSPCPRCEYRDVCRFDAAINRYRYLPSISASEALGALAKEEHAPAAV